MKNWIKKKREWMKKPTNKFILIRLLLFLVNAGIVIAGIIYVLIWYKKSG